MLPTIIRMTKDKYKSFLIYALSIFGFLEMYIALYPKIQEQSKNIEAVKKSFSPEMFKAFNIDPESFSFGSLESYLSTQYMSFLWPLLAIFLSNSMANHIAIREIDNGSIESVASLPIGRTKLFFSRYATGLAFLLVFVIISFLVIIPLAGVNGVDFIAKNYIIASVGGALFIWAVYSLATMVSSFSYEKGKSNMITGGFLMVSYVLNVVAGLVDSVSWLKYFSIFHYFNGSELMNKADLSWVSAVVLIAFALVTTTLGYIKFKSRDLSV